MPDGDPGIDAAPAPAKLRTARLDVSAARELSGLISGLRDEVMLSLARGAAPSTRDLVRLRGVVNELRDSDIAQQMQETLSNYARWSYEQGIGQIDAMVRGEGVAAALKLPEHILSVAAESFPSKVVTIAPQLHEALAREITLGFSGMRTPTETIARISKQFDIARWKAERIAITEIKGMANRGQEVRIREVFAAGRENGVPMVKVWLHSSSAVVGFRAGSRRAKYAPRPHHKAMHNVEVADGELFRLVAPSGTYEIDGPHAESLPAEEVVNCHCSRGIKINREKYKVRPSPKALAAESPRAQPPVSASLKLPKGKLGDVGRSVLGSVDSVHGDGNLSEIPLVSSRAEKYAAALHATKQGNGPMVPKKISVSSNTESPDFSLCHEVGHWLDMDGIGSKGGWASETEMLAPLRKAINESSAIKSLRSLKSNQVVKLQSDEKSFDYHVGGQYAKYLLKTEEKFARAYSQYITQKSGNPAMVKQLEVIRGETGKAHPYASQWSDEDFVSISNEFDNLFKALKWNNQPTTGN